MVLLMLARRVGVVVVGCLAVAACGGGGGGGGGGSSGQSSGQSSGVGVTSQPKIIATVISFPSGASPQGFLPSGFNTDAGVQITAQDGSAITTASVTVNGLTLSYSTQAAEYLGAINVAPGAQVDINVRIAGAAYSASVKQFSAYPTILTPASGSTWFIGSDNLVSWSGATADSSSQYALGVFDTAGNLVYPSNGSFLVLPGNQNSSLIPANSVSAGSRLLLVGIIDVVSVPGAAQGSGLAVGGFRYSGLTLQQASGSLTSVSVTPQQITVSPGKTVQVTAQGTYADGSTVDVTAEATWTSSDPSKVTVSKTGVISGVAGGDADVTATLGGMSGVVHAHVFVPNPSPVPPLSQSVAFQIDYAHSGYATVGGSGPTFPPSATWSATLNGPVSYPIIADGLVIVTTGVNASDPMAYGTSLYALSLATGAVVWGPVTIAGTYAFSAAAYDHGSVFVVNEDGAVRAFVAATGASLWTVTPSIGNQTVPPTAVNGIIYLGGLTALDEATGNVLWSAPTGGGKGAPTVSSDGVFVSVPCNVYKFDPLVGTPLWHYATGNCGGGGGVTAPLSNGKLYTRDYASSPHDQILDAASGTLLGSFGPSVMPAFSPGTGFFVSTDITATISTLTAIDQVSGKTRWTYQGGYIATPPIVIDGILVVANQAGNVYAMDATSGALVWSGNTGTPLLGTDEQNANQLTGLGAGEGWLVVPAGNNVVAWKVVP